MHKRVEITHLAEECVTLSNLAAQDMDGLGEFLLAPDGVEAALFLEACSDRLDSLRVKLRHRARLLTEGMGNV